jgi:hypothetical protein
LVMRTIALTKIWNRNKVYYRRYSVVLIIKWISIWQLVPVLFRVSRSPGDRSKITFTNQFDLSWHVEHDVNHLPQPAVLGIRYRFNLLSTKFKWVVPVPASFKPIKFSSASRTICYNGIYITHRLGTTDHRIFSKQIMLYNSLIVITFMRDCSWHTCTFPHLHWCTCSYFPHINFLRYRF